MPYYVPRTRFRAIKPPSFRNSFWENWGWAGKYIGYPLIVAGLALSVIEIVRILYGPTNRGMTNFDNNDNTVFPERNDALLFPIHGPGSFPRRVEKFHYWPWTYAANLFGTVAIAAGITGVISAHRRSYSSIFAFLSLSLLTALFSGYLIGYYSILVNYYIRVGNDQRLLRPDSMDVGWGLIGTNLAFSCFSCLLGLAGFITAFLGIRGCSPKGMPMDDLSRSKVQYQDVPLVANPPPIRTANVPTQIVNSNAQYQQPQQLVYLQ